MKILCCVATACSLLLWLSCAASAETGSRSAPGVFPEDYRDQPAGPPPGSGIRKYARDTPGRPQENFGIQPIHDNMLLYTFMAERLEYHAVEGDDLLVWDITAWIGRDYSKLYLESEGEKIVDNDVEHADMELLYSRNIHSFWDLQAGLRYDFEPLPSRAFLVLGLQGLAPYWFETDGAIYLSEDGDLSASLELEYDLLLTQRLILQPRLETSLAAQDVPEYDIGAGFVDIELGARLRYEFHRKFAPYMGISWAGKLGETADLVEEAGGDRDAASLVVGVRLWL